MKITHDFHIHTRLSLCAGPNGGTLQGYLKNAKELGLTTLGFAEHFWDAGVGFDSLYIPSRNGKDVPWYYKTQNFEHIYELKKEIDATDTGDVRVLFGVEGEYDPVNHGIAVTEEVAEQLDFIIVPNSHTHMMMDKALYTPLEAHRDYMVKALEEIATCPMAKYVKAIAHPFDPVTVPLDEETKILTIISDDVFKRVFTLMAEKNIAFEINTGTMSSIYRNTTETEEHERMFYLAKACGCKFSFGSDAHSEAGQLKHPEFSQKLVDLLSLTEDDIADFVK
ncbi:MAG: hypothetical protein IJP16_05955 [Clostridia bacterium]|nr:hypothetical protein [Clostridia bacterium]